MQPPDKSQEAQSVRRCPSLTDLVKNIMLELKPLEVLSFHYEYLNSVVL